MSLKLQIFLFLITFITFESQNKTFSLKCLIELIELIGKSD